MEIDIKSSKKLKIPLISIILVLLFLICFNTVSAVDPSEIYVSPAGNDLWNGQSNTYVSSNIGPKKTIKSGVNSVTAGGTVNVASGTYYENNIVIQKDMTIQGAGSLTTTINGNKKGNVFYVNENTNVTIRNLKITNGQYSSGGAIENYGNLNVEETTFSNNLATNFGGAILNYYGTLSVNNCFFTGNVANRYGGAIYNPHGNLLVTGSNFVSNIDDAGGAISNYFGTSDVSYSNFTSNTAASYGGAVSNQGTLTVYKCIFKCNKANNSGGAIHNNVNSILSVVSSIFMGNVASKYGGAVDNLGTAYSTDVYYSCNKGFEGACIFNSHFLNVDTNTFKNNLAYSVGGAVDNYRGTSNLKNSFFTGNRANIFGGAVYNDNQGCSDVKNSVITDSKLQFYK